MKCYQSLETLVEVVEDDSLRLMKLMKLRRLHGYRQVESERLIFKRCAAVLLDG